ncbi:MAG: sigma-70 family RNA polymerase sigma factor [candidate division KSB1 bacterium]|nr:sigma-70 family RNA polymerase sigma factor [candidate division KSB1 bacterium]MDZ7319571.1 sigma-70 family RNA polymerase sigma factor [candidate division KSB1 bacterium]MDZ7342620.1 sigma-70 family RNA polymerase sigma factor [candidate division KSB1 bacterium]
MITRFSLGLMTLSLKELKNTELVRRCAQNTKSREIWDEFYARFDERIWLCVYRECRDKKITRNRNEFKLIVQDLVQDVYKKLVSKNCKALQEFQGASENSIYAYLGMIAKNVVRNYMIQKSAKKRPPITESLDEMMTLAPERLERERLKFVDIESEDGFSVEMMREEIDTILDRQLKGSDSERNKIIFKLFLYEELSPQEIAARLAFSLSEKRIRNIITDIKKILRQELLAEQMMAG